MGKISSIKITKRFVDSLPLSEDGQALYWDCELRGFGVVVGMRTKTYIAQRDINGRTRRVTVGRHGVSRHVFISFSHDDMDEVNLLRGQAKNDKVDLQFDDHSVKEAYDSKNADYIKQQIRAKIDRCSVTVVYLTNDSASSKWVNWEIEESIKRGKGVIGLHKGKTAPTSVPPAFKANGCKAVEWSHEAINKAIEEASKKR